jgi:hypothetical protein
VSSFRSCRSKARCCGCAFASRTFRMISRTG